MICEIKTKIFYKIETTETFKSKSFINLAAGVLADPSVVYRCGKGNISNSANFSAPFPIYKYSILSKLSQFVTQFFCA